MIPTTAYMIVTWGGERLACTAGGWTFTGSQLGGGRWTRENAEKLIPMLEAMDVRLGEVAVVPAPACGCCGAWERDRISIVRDDGGAEAVRCERHAGRLPCIIEGCGRTFALRPGDSYRHSVVCGAHWRQGPKRMRDAVARVRRIAKRRGWSDAMIERHHRLWMRTIRAIRQRGDVGGEGHIDIAEIEAMFGLGD